MSDTNFSTLHKVPLAALAAGTLAPQALTARRLAPTDAGVVYVCTVTGVGDLRLDVLTIQASPVSRVTLRHSQADGGVSEAFTERLEVEGDLVRATFPHPVTFTLAPGDTLDLLLTFTQPGTISVFDDTFGVALLDAAQQPSSFMVHASQVPVLANFTLVAFAQDGAVTGELPLDNLEQGQALRELPGAVAGLAGRVGDLEPLPETVTSLLGRVEGLEALPRVDVTLPARVEALESLTGTVQDLVEDVAALDGLPASVSALDARVDALSGLPGDVSALEQRLDDMGALPDSTGALPGQVLTRTPGGLGWTDPASPLVRLSEVVPQNVDVTGALSSWGTDTKYTFRLRAVAPLSIASIQIPRMMSGGSVGSTLHLLDAQGAPLASGTVFRVNDAVEQADLSRAVSIGAGQEFRVRLDTPLHARSTAVSALPFISPDGLVEVLGTTTGLPYAPPVKFLAGPTLPKTVQGPLDPADLPGYADAPLGATLVKTAEGLDWGAASGGAAQAVLGSGETVLEATPDLPFSDAMNSNGYGSSMALRFTALRAMTFRRLRLTMRHYQSAGPATIEVHRTTGSYATSAETLVTSVEVMLTATHQVFNVLLGSDVTVTEGQKLVLRFVPKPGDLVELRANNQGRSLPLTLAQGTMTFDGGSASDMTVIGSRIPHIEFLNALVKNVLGKLDPRDLKGFADAATNQFLSKDASGAPVWVPGAQAVLGSGETVLEATPNLPLSDAMNSNSFGSTLALRFTVLRATAFRRLRLTLRHYQSAGPATIEVHRTTGSYATSAETLVTSAQVDLTTTHQVLNVLLGSDVAVSEGQKLVLRFVPKPGDLVELRANNQGLALPLTLTQGAMTFDGGSASDMTVVGNRVPHIEFLNTMVKNVVGNLDPRDLKGFADAAPGQFLAKDASGAPVWVAGGSGGSHAVALSTIIGSGFSTSARETGTNNYRMVGPILPPENVPRTYGEVRVPVRNTASKAGITVRVNHIMAESGFVLTSQSITLTGNETELVFPGPFTIPANESHAFLVGAVQGGWQEHLSLFYGSQTSGYPAPQSHVASLLTDVVPLAAAGQALTGLSNPLFSQYRVVNVMASATIPKGVIGTLDPADLPGYASAAVGKALIKTSTGLGWGDAGGEVTVAQAQVDAAVTTAKVAAAVTQAKVEAAVRAVSLPARVVIEGLPYALPEAQPVDLQVGGDWSLVEVQRDEVATLRTFTTVRQTVHPVNTSSTSSGFRLNVASPKVSGSSQSFSDGLGRVLRQVLSPVRPGLTPTALGVRFHSDFHTELGGTASPSSYNARLLDAQGQLLKEWTFEVLTTGTPQVSLPLAGVTVTGTPTLELRATRLSPGRTMPNLSGYYDVNYYPSVAVNAPASGTLTTATFDGQPLVVNSTHGGVQEPLETGLSGVEWLQASLVRGEPTRAVENGALVVRGDNARAFLNLPSRDRPVYARKLVMILELTPRESVLSTQVTLGYIHGTLETVLNRPYGGIANIVTFSRAVGAANYTLAGAPLATRRFRIEVTVVNGSGNVVATYDADTGVKLDQRSIAQLLAGTGPSGVRFILQSSNTLTAERPTSDDFTILRWTEWSE